MSFASVRGWRRVAVATASSFLVAGAVTTAVAGGGAADASPAPSGARSGSLVQRLSALPVSGLITGFGCAAPASPGVASCFGKVRAASTHGHVAPQLNGAATGYGPSDIQSAYGLAGTNASGRTVAIVDANDDPNAEADLAVYRQHFGLPACTTANGCFRKVNQNGATAPLPSTDYGWSEEISLDLDMVSAACPSCHILLVEANSSDFTDLGPAVDTAAATSGVVAVSNSYGGNEDATETASDSYFDHPGVAITVSSGDSGYGVEYPASSPYVTAVGGTTLTTSSSTARGWTESAWSGAGSGCSAYEAKPSWQTDAGCAKRTVTDVSAVADPNTGVAVYDTANSCGTSSYCDVLISLGAAQGADGWVQVGGTSASSPLIASVYALAGNTSSISNGSYPYGHTGALHDVTSGSTGSCGGSYLCTAEAGYDGPTGLGTPNGTGAF